MDASAKEIRIGIIGVGQIGKSHLRNYQEINGAAIVALADINQSEADRVGADYGIDSIYTDYRALLARDDIDAVDVCLHNNLHMPVTVAALRAGKDVYCEKPMAGAYIDAAKMVEVAGETGRKLSIQISSLFSEETKAAAYLIEAGHLGNVYHGRSTGFRRRGRPFVDGYGSATFVQKVNASGGALYDMGVYHIARMLYLMGNPRMERVSGKTYQQTAIDPKRLAVSGYDVEELGLGFVHMEGDKTLDIIESWAVHMDQFEGSSIFGSDAGIRLEPFGLFRSVGDLDLNATADMGGFSWRLHNVRANGDAYDSPQHHWIAALQGRVPLLPTAELALNTMLISEGIYLSNMLGREVTAADVDQLSVSTSLDV